MLGKLIVSEIYDENSALVAESTFENITINKNLPGICQKPILMMK